MTKHLDNTFDEQMKIRDWQMWLADGAYTERWERGFRRNLYHGRTGAFYMSENIVTEGYHQWTLPQIVDGNTLEGEPWDDYLRMRNSQDGATIDQLYVGFPKAHQRQIMAFEGYLPAPAGLDQLYAGFEVNSGGSFAHLTCLMNNAGQWMAYSIRHDLVGAALTDNITLNYPGDWARYVLVHDPPYFEVWQSTVANVLVLERSSKLDMGAVRGKGIPFFANEDSATVCEFRIGNVWVYEIESHPIYNTQTWTNPAADPSLTTNVDGRLVVTIWARSITVGTTVLVQVSDDGVTWRDRAELTTAALNGINQIYQAYDNSHRYYKVTVEENGAGTEIIEVWASHV